MEKINIEINTQYIQVDQLLKLAEIAISGGEAHMMILDGHIQLDGQIISEKRKKIYPGSVVVVDNKYAITVIKEYEAQ